jgi:hypothetical protein
MESGNRFIEGGDIFTDESKTDHATAAGELIGIRELAYATDVDPDATPRDVNEVWGDIVRLFKEPLNEQGSSSLYPYFICPQVLKNALCAVYANEDDFNIKFFTVLRNCLAKENLIDNSEIDDAKDDDDTKIDSNDDNHAENKTEGGDTEKKVSIKTIIFKHGKHEKYAIGIAREAILEHKRGKNQGDSIPFASRKRKLDQNNNNSADNSQRTNSGLVANATVDHCACLLVDTGGKYEVVDCLAAVELKLAKKDNITCEAIPENFDGVALRNSLDLEKNHGSLAQAMLYTMRFALPSLAKLGQLKEEIPCCVLVSKCYRKPDESKPSASVSRPSDDDSKRSACDSKRSAGDSKLATHLSISSTSSSDTSKFASQPSKYVDQLMKNTGKRPTSSVARNRTKSVATSILGLLSRTRTTLPRRSHRNNPTLSVASNLMPSVAGNPTPSDQSDPAPSDQSSPNLSDQSNPTPSDQSSPNLSDRSLPAPTNLSNPSPSPDDGSDSTANDRSNRWVSAKIYVPKACGEFFMYAVTGYGGFKASEADESVDDALSVYLETILFGLRAAVGWMVSKKYNKPCGAVPTSGQAVMIGSKDLTSATGDENLPPILTLRGRLGKIIGKASDQGSLPFEWTISQGEIFTGKLNICHLTEEVKLNKGVFLAFNKEDTDVEVAVKVSSSSVHGYLTHPAKAWNAFTLIYLDAMEKKAEMRNVLESGGQTPPRPPKLDDVLLAVHKRPHHHYERFVIGEIPNFAPQHTSTFSLYFVEGIY